MERLKKKKGEGEGGVTKGVVLVPWAGREGLWEAAVEEVEARGYVPVLLAAFSRPGPGGGPGGGCGGGGAEGCEGAGGACGGDGLLRSVVSHPGPAACFLWREASSVSSSSSLLEGDAGAASLNQACDLALQSGLPMVAVPLLDGLRISSRWTCTNNTDSTNGGSRADVLSSSQASEMPPSLEELLHGVVRAATEVLRPHLKKASLGLSLLASLGPLPMLHPGRHPKDARADWERSAEAAGLPLFTLEG